ncbi:MAG: sulfatase-like hydrolase/transferase [Deltaproteobacteria bacterium]|nr:sulfatase-like hydrolase/transferase [Deltaproteobacteria bacterium]
MEKLSNNISNNMISVSQKIGGALPPALLIVLNIFFFGPFNIYNGNASEFAVSLVSILYLYLLPSLVLLSILTGIGLLLPNKLHRRYVAIIFVVGVLIWLQGNILVWKYGLLDGQGFDWTKGLWRGWIDGSLWLLLLSLGFVLYKRVYKIVMKGSIALISLQAMFLFVSSFQNTEIWKEKEFSNPTSPPNKICGFSTSQNVIQIILDGFQSNIFEEIINDDLSYYQKALKGFTFFKETTGSFPTTRMSMPAILSGKNYKNDVPMSHFIRTVYTGNAITNVAYDNGYEVDFIDAMGSFKRLRHSNVYHIPNPYNAGERKYVHANSALMLDLVLLRAAPHFLKRYIYNNQLWLVQQLLEGKEFHRTFFWGHSAFIEDLIQNLSVNRKKPVYKFIHLYTTKPPFVVNEDCKYSGKVLSNMENAKKQDKCSLDQIVRFLDKLEKAGIYESSLIILQADHGIGLGIDMVGNDKQQNGDSHPSHVAGGALPLLVIKPPYSNGALKVSEAQVMLTDIPATISSLLNINGDFPGLSVFEVDPTLPRERRYYRYTWRHEHWQADFFPRLDEYIITGSVFSRDSWRLGLTYFSPGSLQSTQKIDFGTNEASRFLRSGWGGNEKRANGRYTFNWALNDLASIFLSLPKNEAALLTANIASLPFNKPQRVSITVDGNEVGNWKLSAPWLLGKHSIIIPPDANRQDVSTISFAFSQHQIPEKGGDPRPLAVLFESITLSEVTNANQ